MKYKLTFYLNEKPEDYSCQLVMWTLVGMALPFSQWVETKISRFDIKFMKVISL